MKEFSKKVQEQFNKMSLTGKLFRVELTGQQVWDLYLSSFTPADNPIFRDPASTTKNCNHCNNFIRRYGNIVSIDENYNITTMFDVEASEEYVNTAKVLSAAIKASKVTEVFFETFKELNSLPYESCTKSSAVFQLGTASNPKRYTREEAEKFGVVKPNEIRTFDHLHLFVDKVFVDQSGDSVEAIMGKYRDAKNVFQRAMETISLDTLGLVRDLINQGSLMDGTTHLRKVEAMIPLKAEYDNLPASQRDNWCWVKSFNFPLAKFRNELIGVLCTELSEGMELNQACQNWNKRVDPVNFMRAVAPITSKKIKATDDYIEEHGYAPSFDRRLATMDDIKVSEILHSNVGTGEIKSVTLLSGIKPTATRHKRSEFDGVQEVSIEQFMKDILPGCTSVEMFLTNQHEGNMVSLTTACNPDSKPIFKYNNNFSKTFNGNLAGKSQIKQAVKDAGGKIDGVLRFSITWNEAGDDNSDLDAWCMQPDRVEIGYSSSFRKDRGNGKSSMSGQLDLDITQPAGKLAVENIYFEDLRKMKDGVFTFWVNQYAARNSRGFKAEIEFDNEIYSYEYNRPVSGNVEVAKVLLSGGKFSISHTLPETEMTSREIYGLETNKFHKVNLVCLSPNHWGENSVGNKYYLFMLDGCKSHNPVRSFHAEDLIPELAAHRSVLEVLGATRLVESTDKQLSGVGFNSTILDSVILKCTGSHKRVLKVNFGNG